jgi:hypothetical protein
VRFPPKTVRLSSREWQAEVLPIPIPADRAPPWARIEPFTKSRHRREYNRTTKSGGRVDGW